MTTAPRCRPLRRDACPRDLRALFISNGYPPLRWGGTETYTAGLARGLHRRGHDVHVVCAGTWDRGPQHWNGISRADDDGVSVYRFDLNWNHAPDPGRYLYDNPVVAERLHELLQTIRPDIVHVTSCETLSASVIRAVHDAGIPQVLSLTDFWFLCPRISLLRSDGENCTGQTTPWECLDCQLTGQPVYEVARRVLPEGSRAQVFSAISREPRLTRIRGLRGPACDMADRKATLGAAIALPQVRLTASEFVRRRFIDNGVTAPICLHPYGHDLRWLEGLPPRERHSERLRIAFIGQLIEVKGAHVLVEAVALLPAHVRAAIDVKIYGNVDQSAEYGARLRRRVAALPGVVELAGTYRHEDSAAVFAGIDVLVVPSIWNDFPLIVHEAFAAGVPVVATNVEALADGVTHGTSGLLFERGAGAPAHLAAALRRLAEEPGLVERLRQGLPAVRPVDTELDELDALYASLTG